MGKRLTVSTLAREAGVSTRAIRYWESLGLLPRASRTHTGYRVFPPKAEDYVRFIRKSKAIGLSLREMREVLRLARAGQCPCKEVMRWTEERMRNIESEIQSLSETLARLKRATREWQRSANCSPEECGEVCTLIEHLPEFQSSEGGKADEKILEVCSRNVACCGARGTAGAGADRGDLLPEVPALSMPLRAKRRRR
ncbi:MAG: MerR family DNA-binding transcriptional regulator [Acidobacteriota bacterium]|nr:MerR family DNA-binding transcriptional regulator [Acidobacteriota bacterium]